jgi:hypothetical protein
MGVCRPQIIPDPKKTVQGPLKPVGSQLFRHPQHHLSTVHLVAAPCALHRLCPLSRIFSVLPTPLVTFFLISKAHGTANPSGKHLFPMTGARVSLSPLGCCNKTQPREHLFPTVLPSWTLGGKVQVCTDLVSDEASALVHKWSLLSVLVVKGMSHIPGVPFERVLIPSMGSCYHDLPPHPPASLLGRAFSGSVRITDVQTRSFASLHPLPPKVLVSWP